MSFHTAHLTALQTAPLQQHPAFGAALSYLGRPALNIFLPEPQREVQVMRRRFGPLNVGLISRADIARTDKVRLSKGTGCRLLLVNAETPGPHPGLRVRSPGHVAELALESSAAELKSRMAQNWRNRLNRSLRAGLRVIHGALPADPGHWLLRLDQKQQKAKRYRNYPAVFTAAYAAANMGQARIFEARERGESVAAMLFLCHGSVATYHIGWIGAAGRRAAAHHLLLWRAMLALARRGVTRVDLGQVDTDTQPGLARFKLGAGADCRSLGGTWANWL